MPVALVERDSHPADRWMAHGNAQLPLALEFLSLRLVHELEGHLIRVRLSQYVAFGQDDLAVDAKRRWHAGDDVQIRRVIFLRGGEKAIEWGGGHSTLARNIV